MEQAQRYLIPRVNAVHLQGNHGFPNSQGTMINGINLTALLLHDTTLPQEMHLAMATADTRTQPRMRTRAYPMTAPNHSTGEVRILRNPASFQTAVSSFTPKYSALRKDPFQCLPLKGPIARTAYEKMA